MCGMGHSDPVGVESLPLSRRWLKATGVVSPSRSRNTSSLQLTDLEADGYHRQERVDSRPMPMTLVFQADRPVLGGASGAVRPTPVSGPIEVVGRKRSFNLVKAFCYAVQ